MTRIFRWFLVAAAAALLISGGLAAPPASASTPGCSGISCAGKDPSAMHCNTSMTFVKFSVYSLDQKNLLATGQNVYSIPCKANWAEALSLTSYSISHGYGVYVSALTLKDSNGQQEWMCFPGQDIINGNGCNFTAIGGYTGSSGWPAYTDMVDGTNLAYAEVFVVDSSGNIIGGGTASQ
jgi:hypothetical protein